MSDLFPGELIGAFLIAVVDAALISWITLRLYALAVGKLMRRRMPGTPAGTSARDNQQYEFVPEYLFEGPVTGLGSGDARRLVLAYTAGAASHALIMAAVLPAWSDSGSGCAEWVGRFWTNLWPWVPTLAAVLALGRAKLIRLAAGFVAGGVVTVVLSIEAERVWRDSLRVGLISEVYLLLEALLLVAGVPALLLLLTAWRRVRGVTPLALAATLTFGFALLTGKYACIIALDEESRRAAILAVYARLPGLVTLGYYPVFMLVALPVGGIVWLLLRSLASGFQHKRFSDIQLMVDCWWLVVTAYDVALLSLTHTGLASLGTGVAAFVAYRGAIQLVVGKGSHRQPVAPCRLLLLRVFGYQARTEALFDRIAARWRFYGPIQLIAGPDLAMRTTTAPGILAFIQGQLAKRYIASGAQLAPRLAALDAHPDPDGRFRVAELFCREDSWQPALQGLLRLSDRVLMDARNFSATNSGIRFELRELARWPRGRAVLICDATTDLPLLEETIGAARATFQGSGGRTDDGRITLLRIGGHSEKDVDLLLTCLRGTDASRALGCD